MGKNDDDNPENTEQDGQENSGENFQFPVSSVKSLIPPPGDFPTPVSPIMSSYTAPSSVPPRVPHDHTRQRLVRNPQLPA